MLDSNIFGKLGQYSVSPAAPFLLPLGPPPMWPSTLTPLTPILLSLRIADPMIRHQAHFYAFCHFHPLESLLNFQDNTTYFLSTLEFLLPVATSFLLPVLTKLDCPRAHSQEYFSYFFRTLDFSPLFTLWEAEKTAFYSTAGFTENRFPVPEA